MIELYNPHYSIYFSERTPDLPPPHLRESGIDFDHEPEDFKNSYSNNIVGQCMPFKVDFCKELPYNFTIFPNGLGHASPKEADYVLDPFKYVLSFNLHLLVPISLDRGQLFLEAMILRVHIHFFLSTF